MGDVPPDFFDKLRVYAEHIHTIDPVTVLIAAPANWRATVAWWKAPRAALRAIGVDLRETTPTAEQNWCRLAVGNFLINRAAPLRHKAWAIKREQIDATGADTVVVSCGSCRLNMMAGAEADEWPVKIAAWWKWPRRSCRREHALRPVIAEAPRALRPQRKRTSPRGEVLSCLGSPTWARTRDLRINSPALYQLSYRGTSLKL